MAVVVFIEREEGKVKKSSLEAVSYAVHLAKSEGNEAVGAALGSFDSGALEALGELGLGKVVLIDKSELNHLDAGLFTEAIEKIVQSEGATSAIFSHNYTGKMLAARLGARLKAGVVAGATSLPEGGLIRKNCFSGKGFGFVKVHSSIKVISLAPNSFGVQEAKEKDVAISALEATLSAPRVKHVETVKLSDKIPLTEADRVVSAGRGLKGPENWGMIEELANLLEAATACSRAVSDVDWRPHHEHVGQTGLTISPNLYIAVAISGAIQHLAGVSSSKVIVVINKDPEAPFFKAADYGIVGDAFEVVPKLIEALKSVA